MVACQGDVSCKLNQAFLFVDSFNFNFVDEERSDIYIEDIKNCLNVMCNKIYDLSRSKNEISQILNMVTKLETIINRKDSEINVLQDRVEELEQYSQKENVIIGGLMTRHMSYARVTLNSATAASMYNASEEETNTLEKHVVFFMTSYKLT